MKILTDDLLVRLYNTQRPRCALFVEPIRKAMAKYAIDQNINTVAAFLATIGHESGGLKQLSENLNYSAQGLATTWPKRYAIDPRAPVKKPNALALRLHRNPVAIANNVYANRLGNGDETSGDGWRYRGAGLIQLTGKDNQQRYARATGEDQTRVGDWLRTPEGGSDSAGWFWDTHGLNGVAIHGDMLPVTLVVNGGQTGLAERREMFTRAKGLLA